MKKWGLILLLLATSTYASMNVSHNEGQEFAQDLKNEASQNLKAIDKTQVPGFQTESPSQTALSNGGDFSGAINLELSNSEAAQSLNENAKKRPRYKLDASTDPLFNQKEKGSAVATLEISVAEKKEESNIPKIVTCEEGGEEALYECFQDRQVIPQVPKKRFTITLNYPEIVKNAGYHRDGIGHLHVSTRDYNVDPTTFRQNVCPFFQAKDVFTGQVFNLDCQRVQRYWLRSVPVREWVPVVDKFGKESRAVRYITMEFEHDTYEGEGIDQWISYCDSLEEMTDQGLCRYGEKVCSQGPETRLINGYKVYKDCWQYRQQYICRMVKDDCSTFRAAGCVQKDSKCKEVRQGRCWIYEQTYHCPIDTVQSPNQATSTSGIFCLTGNCQNASYKANGEMLEAISRLAMLKEIQDDIRNQQMNGSFQIFKGQDKYCSRNCVDFKDCCGGKKGWGVALALAMCSNEEKELAKLREQNLCHQVGTYCSKKILGICVSKKTSFCCFGTKFSRLLQAQGRAQLQLDWGTPECPNCRGLSVEELSRIDFSKLDMREVFEEIMNKYKQPDNQLLQQKTMNKVQENLQNIEKGLKSQEPAIKSGVLDGKKSEL